MTDQPADTAKREGAFLALAIADALTLGLPDPDYITMNPPAAGSTTAAGFQFNALHGQDPLPAMQAWASRFGVTVAVSAGSGDPATAWHQFDFTHAGVRIHAYAEIADACAVPGCGHPKGSHWEHGEPQGTRTGCSHLGCKCRGYADEAADPGYPEDAAAQDEDEAGVTVAVTFDDDEDGGCLMPSPTGVTECARPAGHDVIAGTPHRNAGGDEWDGNGWLAVAPGAEAVR